VPLPGRAVQLARSDQDAALGGKQFGRGPAVVRRVRDPQVQARLGVVDGPARLGERRQQDGTPGRVPLALLDHVHVVGKRGRHGRLHRAWHDHSGLLPDRQQVRDQRRVAGHEAGPVTGQVGALGQ